jgi:DNA-directed RNA polymerase specialized sigma24 family protein
MSRLLALRHERAFERMYRRHVADVYRYALAVLRDPEDAEQVTRITFLNAYRTMEQARRHDLNWLLSLTHEVCRLRIGHLVPEAGPVVMDGEPTVDDIRRALARLPLEHRAVLVMREVEGRSYDEIARLLEVPGDEVETLIFRARRSLREQVEGALSCREAQLSISRELDGYASRRERRLLETHLETCVRCNVFVRDQHEQRNALRRLADVELPQALTSFDAERKFVSSAASLR